jgi:protein-S-isoprenylcysteine O-methyltransferase Ste14
MDLLAIGASLMLFVWIGMLPRLFFRPGRRTLQWSLNALPFWIAGLTLLCGVMGALNAVRPSEGWAAATLSLTSLGLSGAAAWLLSCTLATHERPLALWHQINDHPEHIVTSGTYTHIRHPFYASFLIALVGSFFALPHGLTLLALVAGVYRLDRTAHAEEQLLRASDFGDTYGAYMLRTGRFIPRLRRTRSG